MKYKTKRNKQNATKLIGINMESVQCTINLLYAGRSLRRWMTLYLQDRPKKWVQRLMTIILSNLNRLIFFTERFLGKFVVKWIFKIQAHLAYVATLPYETLMSAKQAINDKLQGSVATYFRCGRVVNNQNRKGLLLNLSVFFNR